MWVIRADVADCVINRQVLAPGRHRGAHQVDPRTHLPGARSSRNAALAVLADRAARGSRGGWSLRQFAVFRRVCGVT
jgi:hypothetical protein